MRGDDGRVAISGAMFFLSSLWPPTAAYLSFALPLSVSLAITHSLAPSLFSKSLPHSLQRYLSFSLSLSGAYARGATENQTSPSALSGPIQDLQAARRCCSCCGQPNIAMCQAMVFDGDDEAAVVMQSMNEWLTDGCTVVHGSLCRGTATAQNIDISYLGTLMGGGAVERDRA